MDHPLPRRLVRHPHWPRGWYPMRHDAGPPPPFGDTDEPVPVPHRRRRRGLRDPGRPRPRRADRTRPLPLLRRRRNHPQTQGPPVVRPQRNRETVRGPPARRRPRRWPNGSPATPPSATPWPTASPSKTPSASTCPPRPRRIRAILLELERLYNHVTDIGALCNDVGHAILNAHALRIRETLLRLNQRHHRPPAAPRRRSSSAAPASATCPTPPTCEAIGRRHPRDRRHWPSANSVVARPVHRHRRPHPRTGPDIGTLGYVARASGIDHRRPRRPPLRSTSDADPAPSPRSTGGDVLARFLIRADEIHASIALIADLAAPVSTPAHQPAGRRPGRQPAHRLRGRHRRRLARHHRPPRRTRARRTPDPRQDRRPVLLQLAGPARRPGRHDRPRLPPHQQELQPLLRRQRPLRETDRLRAENGPRPLTSCICWASSWSRPCGASAWGRR